MADEIDMASEQEAMNLRRELAAQAAAAAAAPKYRPLGYCISKRCGEEFAEGDQRLFCDSRCAAEHQRFSNH